MPALARLIVFALLAAAPAAAQAPEAAPPTVTVTGSGTARAVPDTARLEVAAEITAPTADAAMAEAAAAAEAARSAFAALGIEARDIQTRRLSVNPVYARDDAPRAEPEGAPPRIVGFEARNALALTLREIDLVGPALDAALEAGMNRIDGLGFEVGDPAPLLDEARRAAVADARARAELYAESLGRSLGPVLWLTEGGGGVEPFPRAEMATMARMDVAPGESEITASVTIRYALEE